jgi:hypothetical protein
LAGLFGKVAPRTAIFGDRAIPPLLFWGSA